MDILELVSNTGLFCLAAAGVYFLIERAHKSWNQSPQERWFGRQKQEEEEREGLRRILARTSGKYFATPAECCNNKQETENDSESK